MFSAFRIFSATNRPVVQFGEIQLHDIVSKALPCRQLQRCKPPFPTANAPDCLIHLPNPPGPIVIDSKFPLEAYEALRQCQDRL